MLRKRSNGVSLQPARGMKMKLDDLVKSVAVHGDMSAAKARTLIDRLLGDIVDAVARGEDVALPGFGKFSSRARDARTGRNPRTGQPMQIAASTKAVFTPAKAFKDKMPS